MGTIWDVYQYQRNGRVSGYTAESVDYDHGVVVLRHVFGDVEADLLVLSPLEGAIAATQRRSANSLRVA